MIDCKPKQRIELTSCQIQYCRSTYSLSNYGSEIITIMMAKPCFAPTLANGVLRGRNAFIGGSRSIGKVVQSRGIVQRARMTAAAPTTSPTSSIETPIIDLRGKKALVTGIANNRSIAWGIAQQLHSAGAEIGVTYLPMNEKVAGKLERLTEPLSPTLFTELDVTKPEQMKDLAETIRTKWGKVDIVVHCLAYAEREDLEGKFSKTSKAGFEKALNISAYSLIELCETLKPQMAENSSIVTLSYLGAVKVVPNYNIMGIAKSALESSVRYLAAEFGEDGVRINAISAGPIRTLASSAIGGIQTMIKHVEATAPLRRTVTQKEVGNTAAFLLSDAASGITGQVIYVDAGYEIMGPPPDLS